MPRMNKEKHFCKLAPPPPLEPEVLKAIQLAISLPDLDRLDMAIRVKLLAGKLDLANPVKEVCAVRFTCPLMVAALICDIIRSNDRRLKDDPTRVYLKRGERWIMLPNPSVLTLVDEKGKRLNPAVFPESVRVAPAAPLTPEVIE